MKSVVLIIDSPPASPLCLAVFLGIELFGLTFDFGLKNDLLPMESVETSPREMIFCMYTFLICNFETVACVSVTLKMKQNNSR